MTTRLTIPMDTKLRTGLDKKADQLGFDSAQALLRYVSKALIDGREVTFGGDEWGEPPAHVLKRWREDLKQLEADRKAGKVKDYTDVDEALKHLNSL